MINILYYFYLMLFLSAYMFLSSLLIYYYKLMIIFEWKFISLNSMNLEFIFLLDWISLLFVGLIMLISSMVVLYSMDYMGGDNNIKRFIHLIMLFVISMIMMVMSPNIISIMLGWDGLGVVSYCLVIYYQNYSSYNSGMVTVLSNRLGDVGILMSISMMMMEGSWNLMMVYNNYLILFMLLIAAITKSAQVPFSVWLPLAMAAPTPVSALVHSSTLVTAGIYLMIRFGSFFMDSGLSTVLFYLSVITMFMSGLMANFENDLKKIIALSTLSQLGMMMMILSLGYSLNAFYHLVVHAIFKSMLFMASGIIIHFMMNNQDIRLMGGMNEFIPFTMMSFYISNFALCGVPFMSGFYSKDLIMELVFNMKLNLLMMLMIILSLMFTVSYSVRVYYYIFFKGPMKFYSYVNFGENKVMNLSMVLLVILSVISGSLFNWVYFFDSYFIYMENSLKFLVLNICVAGIFLSMVFIMLNFLKVYYLSYFFSFMMFLDGPYYLSYKFLNEVSGIVWGMDKTWVEFLKKYMVLNMIIHSFFGKNYGMYILMILFIYFFMIFWLIM